jgi:hypothetical protein
MVNSPAVSRYTAIHHAHKTFTYQNHYPNRGFGVRISEDAIIPDDKITCYLLVQKARNDKSKFLAQAGFTQENPEALRRAIQSLTTADIEAVEDRSNAYGTFYQV